MISTIKVDGHRAVGVLEGSVGGEDRVVGFNN
jgi:hypothetical protein